MTSRLAKEKDTPDNSVPFSEQGGGVKILDYLLTEFEGRIVSYRPNFFPIDLWPKREARGP